MGLQNYQDMLSDPVMRTVVLNTLLWAVVTISVPMVLGLLLAVFLNDMWADAVERPRSS